MYAEGHLATDAQRLPLNLLDALRSPEDYEEGRNRLVFLSRVVATRILVAKIKEAINNE